MKFKLNANQVSTIKQNTEVLRAYGLFTMELSNKINAVCVAVLPTVKKLAETQELINEKQKSIFKIENADQKEKAFEALALEVQDENKKSFNIDLPVINLTEFTGIDIKGDKEVEQGNGAIKKFSFRDAYYDLVNEGVIV